MFKQDFETVVQGLYPFVLSSAQGISDPATHLSQLNAPYTQAGWNGRVIDDVIDGNWSLKHHDGNTGIIYQTIPQNFRFEPGKVYTVEFDYQSGPDKAYAMVVGDGTTYTTPSDDEYLAQARGEDETKHVKMQVVGSGSGQTWIGLYENGSKAGTGSMGQRDFVLDNLVITEEKDATSVTLESTELYKGETAKIYGNNLDQVTWETSNDKVAVVDKEAGVVKALAAGTATLTATLSKDEKITFEITVTDGVVTEIPREEFDGITSSANTEQSSGEPAGSGVASAATDGDSSTYWHSQWSGFTVSKENPAILTVDLGKEMSIGGFKFQQRPGTNNGIVYKYHYEAFDAAGEKVASSDTISVDNAQRAGGQWITSLFESVANVKTIKIYVEEGKGNFAAIAEVVPLRMQKVADSATLDDVTIKVGEKVRLEAKHNEDTILTGIVWSSSDKEVVKVNQNGVVTGLKAGTATITIKNAIGKLASCTVTVTKDEVILDKEDLQKAIDKAETLDLDKYKDGVEKDAFKAALSKAKDVLANAKTQDEIDEATSELNAAINALKEVEKPVEPSADKSKLEKFYKDCLAYYKETNHSKENWQKYQTVLADVKAVLENENATQDEVDNALKVLVEITGILNGTTNYMLTKMFYEGADYASVLKEAQDNGYAERNPEADVEGYDACRKIAILSSLISGQQVDFEDIYCEGITKITVEDMRYAKAMGTTIKLLASSKTHAGRLGAMVAPCMLYPDHPLYNVNDVFNAIFVHGNVLGDTMFYGSGAGKLPTASAVVSDVVEAAKNLNRNVMTMWKEEKLRLEDKSSMKRRFFIRMKGNVEEKIEDIRYSFGDVEIVKVDGLDGEFGFVTPIMMEGDYDTRAKSYEDQILHMIRIED